MSYTKEQIEAKAKRAIEVYLERFTNVLDRNYEAEGARADFIIQDDEGIAVVAVSARDAEGEMIFENQLSRREFERITCLFLGESIYQDAKVRMDTITAIIVGEDRALIKWHRNALADDVRADAVRIAGLLDDAKSQDYAEGVLDALRKIGYEAIAKDGGFELREI